MHLLILERSNNGTSAVIAKIGGFNTFNGTGYDGALTFSTRKSAGNTMNERLRITKDGNVGIGTDGPEAPLHVATAANTATIAIFGSTDGTTGSTYQALAIKNDVASYPAIANVSSTDTIDVRSAGSVQVTIDHNNNDTTKFFRVTVPMALAAVEQNYSELMKMVE